MKHYLKSRTIWLNGIAVAALILSQLVTDGEALGVPPEVLKWIAFVYAVANLVLRFVTTQAVTLAKPEEGQEG